MASVAAGQMMAGGIPAGVRREIRRVVLDLRGALQEDFTIQLRALGITASGVGAAPARALPPHDARAREMAAATIERERVGGTSAADAFGRYVRESAFTFLNRLVGLRCLEARGLLLVDKLTETAVTIDPARNASSLYARVRSERRADPPRELWRETFRRACVAISEYVRVLFDPDSEYAALFPQQSTLQHALDLLNDTVCVPTEAWVHDEILGWVYQYFNADEKARLFARGSKFEGDELIPVTQLYTERYMVDYLLQNTLGQYWAEQRPDSQLPASWPYYDAPQPNIPPLTHAARRVRDITILDPCCGSGQFLLRAFDLLMDMYAEEGLERTDEVPGLILARNLYGIDIDLRAVQLASLSLYIKARSTVGPNFRPVRMNLVAADVTFPSDTQTFSYPGNIGTDPEIVNLVQQLWDGLFNVREFGSLLHPERPVNAVIERKKIRLHSDHQMSLGELPPTLEADRWEAYKRDLLDGLREEFERQARSDDVSQHLFGEEAAKGIGIIEALNRQYDIVVTNPPYIGSSNLNDRLRRFVQAHYQIGKRDIYAAFIIRCESLARDKGYIGMVTQRSFLNNKHYAELRDHIIQNSALLLLADLGPHAFVEQMGEKVSVALHVRRKEPGISAVAKFCDLRRAGSAAEKQHLLAHKSAPSWTHRWGAFLSLPGNRIMYSASSELVQLFSAGSPWDTGDPETSFAFARRGLDTGDIERWSRYWWETVGQPGWVRYVRGPNGRRWNGGFLQTVLWEQNGEALRRTGRAIIPNESLYFIRCATFSRIGTGGIVARVNDNSLISDSGSGVFSRHISPEAICALLNSRIVATLLQLINPSYNFQTGDLNILPAPRASRDSLERFQNLSQLIQQSVVDLLQSDLTEPAYYESRRPAQSLAERFAGTVDTSAVAAAISVVAGALDRAAWQLYDLSDACEQELAQRVGIRTWAFPLVGTVQQLSTHEQLNHQLRHPGVTDYLHTLGVVNPSDDELDRLRTRLRKRYVAGRQASRRPREETVAEVRRPEGDDPDDLDTAIVVPTPAETFLEEMSRDLAIHPLSVFLLLEDMRAREVLVSPPEMKRQLEDWASASVLKALGFRWIGQSVPENITSHDQPHVLEDQDGIISLVRCSSEHPPIYEHLGQRLEYEFGLEGREVSEDEFRRYVGRDLSTWLRDEFFKRHVQQFKQRPIVWHLSSSERAFEVLILYHRLSRETLRKIRTQYAGMLIERLRAEEARNSGDSSKVREIKAQIEDVEEFRQRLERIERGDELKYRIRCRWKGEDAAGRPGPYAPDLDDGVKVNIRPFQEAGLLAMREVIKKW